MRHLSVFSGIGGDSLGLKWAGMETVAFCENDKKCQLVLKKHWPGVPIFDDIRELNAKKLEHLYPIDIISGGFPCQPFSSAGKQKGTEDDRHLWPEYFRLIQEIRPRWVIAENVAGIQSIYEFNLFSEMEGKTYRTKQAARAHFRGISRRTGKGFLSMVVDQLKGIGYEVSDPFIIPACAVNAPHRRDRVWIVGYSKHNGLPSTKVKRGFEKTSRGASQGEDKTFKSPRASGPGDNGNVANTNHQRESQPQRHQSQSRSRSGDCGGAISDSHNAGNRTPQYRTDHYRQAISEGQERKPFFESSGHCESGGANHWTVEPNVGRVAHGVSNRVDRLRQLGNAIVPQVIEIIGKAIMEIENA